MVATTRPETMLGDTAVAVHPEDERYQSLIGKTVILPLANREIPIIADDYVDREFGTGVVKITPAHDFNDYEVGKRHQLPMVNVMTLNADIRDEAEIIGVDNKPLANYVAEILKYRGMERFAARKQIVADFEALGLLEEIKPHDLKVPYGDRGGVPIEPMLTDQWYVSVKPLAEVAIKAVEDGESNLYRNNMKISISLGCVIFKIGVFPDSYGGDTAFLLGMMSKAIFMLHVMKRKCVKNIS